MLRTKLLNRITRHARPSAEEDVSLYPTHPANGLSDMCQPSENDLSYEDALVDTQARLFFRSELGNADMPDPSLALGSLLSRIEGAQEPGVVPPRPAVVSPLNRRTAPSFAQALRRSLSGAIATRIVPSGVALLFLLTVLGSDLAQLLRTDTSSGYSISDPVNSTRAPNKYHQPQDKLGALGQAPQLPQASVPLSAAQLHPVEMGMEPNERDRWARANPQFFDYYERTKIGPE